MSGYRVYSNKVLPDGMLVKKIRQAAKVYNQYVDKDILMVYAKSKNGPFFSYEFYAGKQHFQHLAGVQSPNGATLFFDRCLDEVNLLQRKEIVVKENINTTSAKIKVLANALDLTKSKMFRCGDKNLITLSNSFDVAIGNTEHVLGIDRRSSKLPIPVTVMDRSIYEFCSDVSRIYLIMLKDVNKKKYTDIFYEITKDIINKTDFNDKIKELIDESLFIEKSMAEAAAAVAE